MNRRLRHYHLWHRNVLVGLLILLVGTVLSACGQADPGPQLAATSSTANVYKGRAAALKVKALVANVVLADTGTLPTTGGSLQKTVLTANVPGLLSAGVLHAATVGQGNRTHAEASVAGLNLNVAGVGIRAAFISSQAQTLCSSSGRASVSGSSQLVGLMINGKSVRVTGSVNQTISVLGLVKIVINEQTGSASGLSGKKTVNALHVSALGIADVVVASSSAELICKKPAQPAPGDYITGSGTIKPSCGASCGTFSLSAGYRGGVRFGSLTYIDSSKNYTVRSTSVTSYSVVNSTTRFIKGKATLNGRSGYSFEVRASDNGAGSRDTFSLKLLNSSGKQVYYASGTLVCGNLTLHKSNPACSCK